MQAKQLKQHQCERACCSNNANRAFKRLLIAVDGSEPSNRAAAVAAQLAPQLHADIILVNVFSAPHITDASVGFVEGNLCVGYVEASDALLRRVRETMPVPSKVEVVLREGDAATEILKAATVYAADLIVMGTHGRGRIAQAILGGVAQAVTQRASCPVLTVPMPAPAAPTEEAIQGEPSIASLQ